MGLSSPFLVGSCSHCSCPHHLPAAALHASHMGSRAQRDCPGKCFCFHFSLSLISGPAVFPAPCGTQWRAQGVKRLSLVLHLLVKKTKLPQRKIQKKCPQIKEDSPKPFFLMQELCKKVQKSNPCLPRGSNWEQAGGSLFCPCSFTGFRAGTGTWWWQEPRLVV